MNRLVILIVCIVAVLHPFLAKVRRSNADENVDRGYSTPNSSTGRLQFRTVKVIKLSFEEVDTRKKEVQIAIVDHQNELRKNVKPSASGMLKMQWNQEAADGATMWAKKCTMEHSGISAIKTSPCGENLFMSGGVYPWRGVADAWYGEREHFTYGKGGKGTGHYTQQVWETSYMIGCGVAHCPENKWKYFYVCWYCPPGNYLHILYKPYRLGRNCKECPKSCEDGLCLPCIHNNQYRVCSKLKKSFGCGPPLIRNICSQTCRCDGIYAI
ncbi:cysteine-rich venom protein TEL1-like [Latimeria chalumnae]|uniref:cysteine-rich venom protein TEL1-like n=1 Tax=Latimeria chalumnae TaxID=7897 RepID=UPI00313EA574